MHERFWIYTATKKGEKKSEWCLFYMDFLITARRLPLQTHSVALFLETWIRCRWEQMGLSAFWTVTTATNTVLLTHLKDKMSRVVAEKLCSFKISWNRVIQKAIFKRHELLGKTQRVVGCFWRLTQQSWNFLNLNMSNKGNNYAIFQGVMCHLLNKSVPKE